MSVTESRDNRAFWRGSGACGGSRGRVGDTKRGEAREVDRGGEEIEVGVHLQAAADTGASPAASASHQVAILRSMIGRVAV